MKWKIGIPISLFSLILSGAIYFILIPEYIQYEEPRYGIISTPSGIILRKQPKIDGERILVLKNGSITTITGETRDKIETGEYGTDIWYKLKTRSGHEGWGFKKFISPLPPDIANLRIQRDRSAFEDRLKKIIIEQAYTRLRSSGQFPFDDINDLRIVSELEPISSHSFNVDVRAFLKGALLGIDEKLVRVRVNLELEIDKNYLNASRIRVRHTDIIGYDKIDGIDINNTVSLLAKIL